ncbi:FAD-dependent monooxygenase [Mucilaginibacter sp. BJC16-A38]|uniref:FAD-dependent oxidoreductase n=1 Tax=Mucilaginibacter phenanthrenivorans TaxID=1234842 RepID=UPI0021581B9C|nr:NAD(P)/FAD-dependent oxidoreductase [Mucilaginibacter phenanthrenivorans]MCR8558982.1 FAD-dependent monooxygenase [Mucilaginibacter phenanthrenivorans]
MSLIENKKIAIVGGGPGGLTLARLLQMNGADVKVYERDLHKDARAQGATLDLHDESGLKALREAGLIAAFLANYRPGAELVRIIDKYATIIAEDQPTPEEEIGRPEIDRGPLQKILLESLQPGTVTWDCNFDTLSQQDRGWKLRFKNGTTAFADLVIAADGANSKLRPYVTPIKPFYSGIMVVEASVYNSETASPRMHKLLRGGKIFAFGDSKTLIVSSKGDGSLVFYTSFKAGEGWPKKSGIDFSNKALVLDWFKTEYDGWDAIWQELFENAAVPFVTRPIYCMPLDQTWEPLPNLTLLGDAAHLMPPFAGEGVNMAMLDALELSECLTGAGFDDLQSAIAAYETAMRARATEAAQESLDSGELLHSPGAISFMMNMGGQGSMPAEL